MTSTNKIATFAIVMAFAFSIGVSGIPEADAKAVDEKLVKFAKQLEKVQDKVEQATGDKKLKLEQEESDLIKFLNQQGLATDEQFNEDPSYWIDMRYGIVEAEQEAKNNSVNQVFYEGDSKITLMCGCTDALKLKAGYSVYAYNIWWPHWTGSWTYVEDGDQGYSTVDFDDSANDYVKPFQYTESKSAVTQIDFDWDYVAHDAGWDEIDDANGNNDYYYPYLFSNYSDLMGTLNDVETDSEFRFDVEVNSLGPP